MAELPANDLMPAEELSQVDQEAFGKKGCALSNSETAFLLSLYNTQRTHMNPNYQLPPAVRKTKEYTEKFRAVVNEEACRVVRQTLQGGGMRQYEYALMANLMPETAEEAFALVPSLKDPNRLSEDKLQELLNEAQKYREFQ